MDTSDIQKRADWVRRPAVLRAREWGLLGRRTGLAAILQTQLRFQAELITILDERYIPEVQELLTRLQQQMLETNEHLHNVQASLCRQDQDTTSSG